MSEFELSRLFLALVSLLGLAHGLGYACDRCGLPRVIGEIGAGLLLGPSVFGSLFPELQSSVFNAFDGQSTVLSALYWIGLIALMFTSGFRIKRHFNRQDTRFTVIILASSTIIPFAAGWMAPSLFDFSAYAGSNGTGLALIIVIAIAFSVTSIPVISKIFTDLGIIDTRFARIVLAVATAQDLILWTFLSVATGLAQGTSPDAAGISTTVVVTILFIGLALIFAPGLLNRVGHMRFNLVLKSSATGYLFFICFLFVTLASFLSINLVFGALIAGIVVGSVPDERLEFVKERISDVSHGLFIPVYFALVGLKIDLPDNLDPVFTVAFILISSAIVIACVTMAVRLSGQGMLSSLNFGMAMNTRGGPGIVLASVALEFAIINQTFYVTLVSAAVITSLISGIWFRQLLRRGLPLMNDRA
jgi:Kef-type K+ transport system membrane component KefB